jgi:hypothetical protein
LRVRDGDDVGDDAIARSRRVRARGDGDRGGGGVGDGSRGGWIRERRTRIFEARRVC